MGGKNHLFHDEVLPLNENVAITPVVLRDLKSPTADNID
jgi:hypothetical protein